MTHRKLTAENLSALDEQGQLIAVLVSPRLLAELVGNRIGPDDSYLVLDSVSTWDEYVLHAEHQREYLVVTPTLMTVRKDATEAAPSAPAEG